MPTNFLKILVLTAHEMYIVLKTVLQVLWWKTKKGGWHRSRKKGKRETQHSRRHQKQTWYVLGDISKASWLKTQNRHRIGLSEWWCCQKSHKNLDRRAAILYFKCKQGGFTATTGFFPCLLQSSAITHPTLCAFNISWWKGIHRSEQKPMLRCPGHCQWLDKATKHVNVIS